ncbi:3-oxoacyl-ACP reductase [Bacillus sp. ISL-47]|uniref:3-oxoacyl-ACP reductase n=1 Tax=Bacillus sp. ISL-47 TaxID=2819130 RepID=UPI001BEA7BF6|nr:3-oxoacyl-ACP reductase [Bacillus sp. ISL-47]MBT2689705.1 3-oxoacyl-ACP reductase [Bacillus sp. ISL-47]MBT2710005.1 3-oxoacyl-ACP reductase [Pseudomonas sp. ISL-84]
MKLQEQIVLITGGSRGLGRETAKAFAREGARVVINYFHSEEKAYELQNEIGERAIAIQADIRDKRQVVELFEKAKNHFGTPITTIVNNALVNFKFDPVTKKDAETIGWEDFQIQLEGAVRGALNTVQAGLADMKLNGFGRVISIGTNLFQNPVVPYHDYTTSKAALLGFTRNMANELGQYGITVNMVSGGLLKTTDASAVTSNEVFEIIENSTPLKKVTDPAEAADAIVFFASPWARAVTGQNLVVDGGLVMN